MRTSQHLWLAPLVALALGCSEREAPLSPNTPTTRAADVQVVSAAPALLPNGVGTMGVLEEVKPHDHLVMYQTGFEFKPGSKMSARGFDQHLAVGSPHTHLQVHISDTTQVYLNGEEKTIDDLTLGSRIIVVGRLTGSSLHAELITGIDSLAPPPSSAPMSVAAPRTNVMAPAPFARNPVSALSTTSLCMGQDLDYTNPAVLEFQGCWGGPSAADDINLPFIPVFCPLIGCFGLDRFTYTAAAAGWGFAFPFEMKATSAGLTYHVPGQVALQVNPLDATTGSFSFWGGIGLSFGLNFDFCSFFGCYDIGTVNISVFSMIHQATGAGPLTGQFLDIAEAGCPSVGVIPIEGIPIDPLAVGFCEDLDLSGQPFNAYVQSTGANPQLSQWIGFGPSGATRTVRPDAMNVNIRYDNFAWSPTLEGGLYFRVKTFGIKLFDTPTIPIFSGAFDAVTTPFPTSVFSVATDPLSPVNDLRYLFQPSAASFTLGVAPAGTRLTITSSPVLSEGTPLTAQLVEAYDGTPIGGRLVVIEATGLAGTASRTLNATTNSSGVASMVLPIGEYDVTVRYDGAQMYLPTSTRMPTVYVYRPTTFVIWSGNAGGLTVGARYQFWGSGWSRQVRAGAFGGNASFLGFATPTSAVAWSSEPGSSGPPPASVPDLIGVIVTNNVTLRGARATGNIAGHALLRVELPSDYHASGGHDTWGIMRLVLP